MELALKHPTLEDNQNNENQNSWDLIPSVAKGSFKILIYYLLPFKRMEKTLKQVYWCKTVRYDSKIWQ